MNGSPCSSTTVPRWPSGVGVLVGVVVGAAIGAALGQTPIGAAAGVALGAAVDHVLYRPPPPEADAPTPNAPDNLSE
jgi:hypothetical protein